LFPIKKSLDVFFEKVACDVGRAEVMVYLTTSISDMRDTQLQMQNRSYAPQPVVSSSKSPATKAAPPTDELTRVFNTAIVSSQAGVKRDFSSELRDLTDSASFKAILNAVRQLARVQGVNERQAAEQVISTFRKMDEVWGEYIFREGLDRLRNPRR